MRKIISISVSEEMHSLILRQCRARSYGSVSEYVRHLVHLDNRELTPPIEHEYPLPRPVNDLMDEIAKDTA